MSHSSRPHREDELRSPPPSHFPPFPLPCYFCKINFCDPSCAIEPLDRESSPITKIAISYLLTRRKTDKDRQVSGRRLLHTYVHTPTYVCKKILNGSGGGYLETRHTCLVSERRPLIAPGKSEGKQLFSASAFSLLRGNLHFFQTFRQACLQKRRLASPPTLSSPFSICRSYQSSPKT